MFQLPPVEPGWRRVFLIRHGETDANKHGLVQGSRTNPDLNEVGTAQAQALGEFLKDMDIGMVCSSALERAKQTASHVFGHHQSQSPMRKVLDGLNEMDYGAKWDGVHLSTITNELQGISRRWSKGETSASCPGGESPEDVLLRVKHTFGCLAEDAKFLPQAKIIVVVAHNFVNRILLSHVESGSTKDMQKYNQGHSCINVLDLNIETREIRALKVNYSEHLAKL